MENLLNQIRGVVGVTGAMIMDRYTRKSSIIFPASFDDTLAQGLKQKFLYFMASAGSESLIKIKFAKGWAFIKMTPNFGFLVLARPDLNIPTLNLVLKSVAIAMEQSRNAEKESGELIFDKDSVFSLLRAINLVGEHFSENISRFQIAELYRKSKAMLIDQYPDLKHFSVDHNGEVFLIKGSELQLDPGIIDAVAEWMVNFKELIRRYTVIAGFDLKNVTKEVRSELENLSFYRRFQKSSPR